MRLLLTLLVLDLLAIAVIVTMKNSLVLQLGAVRYQKTRTAIFLFSDAVSIFSLSLLAVLHRKDRRENVTQAEEEKERQRASDSDAEPPVDSETDAWKDLGENREMQKENMGGD